MSNSRKKKTRKKRPSSIPTEWATNNRKKLLAKTNEAEEHIQSCLSVSGLLYRREYECRVDGKDRFIDFVAEVGSSRIAIEVDGAHHFTGKGQIADRKREDSLIKAGEVDAFLRLSWKQTMQTNAGQLKELLLLVAQSQGRLLLY